MSAQASFFFVSKYQPYFTVYMNDALQ